MVARAMTAWIIGKGLGAPRGNLKKQLLSKIHGAADRAIAAWLSAPLPPGPPARPKEPAPAWPQAQRYDIIEGDVPLSVSSSSESAPPRHDSDPPSHPSLWSIAQPPTPAPSAVESPVAGPSRAAS